ncbi:MAG: ParA family protein [Desulfobacteraceae bacterium]|nr:ParA family protein [Desulfobacteraceae bacterium]
MGKIISIVNHNKESGKTVISFNLACSLSVIGKKTLYLTFKNNSYFEKMSIKFITEKLFFEDLEDFPYTGFKSIIDGLDFFVLDVSVYEPEENKNLVLFLKKYFKLVYDYVIIDTQSSLIDSFDFFMILSDEYIIPMENSSKSFDSLVPLLARMEWLKKEGLPELKFSGFLLNKVFEDSRLYNLFRKNAFFLFKKFVLDSFIIYSPLLDSDEEPLNSILDNVMDKSFMCFIDLAELITKGENP